MIANPEKLKGVPLDIVDDADPIDYPDFTRVPHEPPAADDTHLRPDDTES
ncbi:hypothetical protein ACIRL2_19675 [Embleya sp. NPDC127516]